MKIFLRIIGVVAILIVSVIIFILITWDNKIDAPYPDVKSSSDSVVIARGKYLVFGPAHCATCHVPMDKIMEVENGLQMPLSGGWEIDIPPGVFRATNLTPDLKTGIGKLTDGEIARTLRYSVGSDGRYIAPFMPFQDLTDEDLVAIISYLRSQEPVEHEMKKSEISFLGKALITFGILKPEVPKNTPLKSIERDSTVQYGGYLANYVAECMGCHTERDLKTTEFIGPPFAGGFEFEPNEQSEGYGFVSPNLTPDPETGVIYSWDEDRFINRFHSGSLVKGSPMPWGAFSRINDLELKAIYKYLRSLKPVSRKIEKTVYLEKEKLPE
ncbi:MAG: cytochrome c [Ignavibacteriaceae bacterium]|nr:cytochrome c [Ignavibacteriaceae bacterium]